MAGWRLGYAVAPEPWMTGLRKKALYSSNGVQRQRNGPDSQR